MIGLIELFKDPYERKARLTPGLLVALPVLVPLVCVYGPRHPVLTAVVGLLGGCGALYALASIARGRGKKLEEGVVVLFVQIGALWLETQYPCGFRAVATPAR